jgi:polysaccharide export outer membrane protein
VNRLNRAHVLVRACAAAAAAFMATVCFAQDAQKTDSPLRYRIEANDVLTVKYRYTPEYDYTLTVQPDGFISLPIVGELKVGGLTVEEAIRAIQKQASLRLRDPEVTVELKEFDRPRFYVGGEVGKPGEFALRGRVGVLEAVAMAGGFKPSAKHSQVVLFRQVDKVHATRTVYNAKELVKNVEAMNVDLQPGDLLFVPQNRVSKVMSVVPLAAMVGTLGSIGIFINYLNH